MKSKTIGEQIVNRFMLLMLLIVGFTLLVGIYLHGNFVQENRLRDGLIAEQEFYLADIWSEKEDYKEQLGIFIRPKKEE